jgi:hypothetical protein
MYFITVLLLLFVLPVGAVSIDLWSDPGLDLIWLIGKWFTFSAVGLRLFLAGVRQNLQPEFTARAIFEIEDAKAHAIVREVGFGNLAMGTAGLLTLLLPSWLPPAAFVGGIYYGLAGIGHAIKPDRNAKENVALFSDILASLVLIAFVASVALNIHFW